MANLWCSSWSSILKWAYKLWLVKELNLSLKLLDSIQAIVLQMDGIIINEQIVTDYLLGT